MDSIDRQVTELVAAFEKERDPARLHEALELIEAAERSISAGDAVACKQAISRRFRFFTVLDLYIDLAWKLNEKPAYGVPPPSSHRGEVNPSGEVDPESIFDPVERAEYVRALKANKESRTGYDVQFQLRRIDERATAFFELFVVERYTDSPAGRKELEDLLAASEMEDARKKRLSVYFKKAVIGTSCH